MNTNQTKQTSKATRPEQQLLFDPRFLEQYTGRTLLHDPVSAIVELVANGLGCRCDTGRN